MKLADYLAAEHISAAEFARRIGTTRASASRWVKGKRIPRPDAMQAIKAATCGKVSADDFHEGRAA